MLWLNMSMRMINFELVRFTLFIYFLQNLGIDIGMINVNSKKFGLKGTG